MKTAAKVFIIIGMIYSGLLIFPIIIGIFALKRIENASTKDELTTYGILVLIFVNLLGGIFMLCIKEEDLKQNQIDDNYYDNDQTKSMSHCNCNCSDNQTDNQFDLIQIETFDELD